MKRGRGWLAKPIRKFDGRAHFFGAAAEAMRRILIDKARRKQAIRHGGDQQRVNLIKRGCCCAGRR